MENVEHFGRLTERMKEFREEVLDEKPYIDAQRAILATLAYKENLNQPRVMVRAKMLEKVLDHMSIYILKTNLFWQEIRQLRTVTLLFFLSILWNLL